MPDEVYEVGVRGRGVGGCGAFTAPAGAEEGAGLDAEEAEGGEGGEVEAGEGGDVVAAGVAPFEFEDFEGGGGGGEEGEVVGWGDGGVALVLEGEGC